MPEIHAYFDPLTTEIRGAAENGYPMIALMGALALPAIAAALEDGNSTRDSYIAWLVAYGQRLSVHAELIYGLRCSLLHEGSAYAHRTTTRMGFIYPGFGTRIHGVLDISEPSEPIFFWDIPTFVKDLVSAIADWIERKGELPNIVHNLEKMVRLRPDGFRNYKMPVIV